jgi:hypothetical protein
MTKTQTAAGRAPATAASDKRQPSLAHSGPKAKRLAGAWQFIYDGRELAAVIEQHADGWHVKEPRGADLGVFPTRSYAISFINAKIKNPHAVAPKSKPTGGGGMQTKRIPKSIFRSKIAQARRKTRQAQRHQQRERELHATEYAAYEARQPELIKQEDIERGRG